MSLRRLISNQLERPVTWRIDVKRKNYRRRSRTIVDRLWDIITVGTWSGWNYAHVQIQFFSGRRTDMRHGENKIEVAVRGSSVDSILVSHIDHRVRERPAAIKKPQHRSASNTRSRQVMQFGEFVETSGAGGTCGSS